MKTYSGELHECPKCQGTGAILPTGAETASRPCDVCDGLGYYAVTHPFVITRDPAPSPPAPWEDPRRRQHPGYVSPPGMEPPRPYWLDQPWTGCGNDLNAHTTCELEYR